MATELWQTLNPLFSLQPLQYTLLANCRLIIDLRIDWVRL